MDISYISPINKLGYGNASKNILRALLARGHNVSLFPINRIQNTDIDFEDVADVRQAINNAVFYNDKAPSVRIWHQNDLALGAGRGPKIAFPFFELDTFNEVEKHHLSSQDAIFVASKWAQDVVYNNNINVPTYVVPLGVNTRIFHAYETSRPQNSPTVFLNVGKWEIRKGHDVLVTAFNLAFKPEDNVELWMLPHNPFLTPEQTARWHDIYLGSELGKAGKIKILDRLDKHEEVAILMSRADIGVFPARAEGWNLELLEMMSMGKTVITTNCTAHTEFCNNGNSLLLDVPNLEDAHDGIWFNGQGKWHEIDEDAIYKLADMMKKAKEQKGVNFGGLNTGKQYTWDNSANLMVQHLEKIV